MEVVQLLITADCVHVRVETFARFKPVALQGISFPFREGLNYFEGLARYRSHIELYRPLNSVQIIIKTGCLINEKRRGYSLEIHLTTEFFLKCIPDKLDCCLCLAHSHVRIIRFRKY